MKAFGTADCFEILRLPSGAMEDQEGSRRGRASIARCIMPGHEHPVDILCPRFPRCSCSDVPTDAKSGDIAFCS